MPPAITTYEDAIAFLLGRIDFERRPARSHECFRLDRTRRLLASLGNPQERIPVVHVAGTKGKGSTSTMIAAALTACGLRTGLFTSPHLERVEERFLVDGRTPSPGELTATVAELHAVLNSAAWGGGERPTFFELLTAAAWLHFERRGVDLAVLEVGLGGRLDATNVCRPEVALITNVSRDHMAILGDRPAQIAVEKAGIVKPGVPCVSGVDDPDAREVVVARCRDRDAALWELGRQVVLQAESAGGEAAIPERHRVRVATPRRAWPALRVPLAGEHQARNAALALAALDRLDERGWRIDPEAASRGIEAASLPLRVEVLGRDPLVVCDAAHNEASIRALVETTRRLPCGGRRIAVFGTSRDKDHEAMLRDLLPAFDEIVLTRYEGNPRGTRVALLADAVRRLGREARSAATPRDAARLVEQTVAPADLVCITGSFFLAAEMRSLLSAAPAGTAASVAAGATTV